MTPLPPSQTSLIAWMDVQKDITERQNQVIQAIRELNGVATMHAVAFRLNLPLHTISGRFSELVKCGRLEPVGRTDDNKTLFRVANVEAFL